MGELEPDIFTKSQKRGALREINLKKEKIYENLKGRACANGRPQRCYIPKDDVLSPTIQLGAIFSSLVIDAHEGRYVAIFDVPGVHFNAYMPGDKFIILKIEREFVDILCEENPEPKKCTDETQTET